MGVLSYKITASSEMPLQEIPESCETLLYAKEITMKTDKKPRCYNCKFAGSQFKIGNLTHLHCFDEKQYSKIGFDNGDFTAWDTLRIFSDTCKFHEFKDTKK